MLFNRLSERLKEEINGPVVTMRSGDASNLKAALKQLIRAATNQKSADDEEEEGISFQQDVGIFLCRCLYILTF
jgi:origin recognition complex subunit 3